MSASSSDDVKAEIRRSTDIVDLVSSYVPLKRAGRRFKALCPFHKEKTPSFTVNPEMQIFKCFGCGVAGDVFTFVMKMEGVEFPEAMRILGERSGIDTSGSTGRSSSQKEHKALVYRANDWAARVFQRHLSHSDPGKACLEYLGTRGIGESMREQFRLGFAMPRWDDILRSASRESIPEELLLTAGLIRNRDNGQGSYDYFRNRLMFPIVGTDGRVLGFGGRALDPEDTAKYLNSPDTPVFNKGRIAYGLYQARKAMLEKRQVVVMEGYTDVIMAHQQGIANAVAVLGTALTREHIQLLRRYADEVVLVFDGDAAGQRSADRSLDLFVEEDVPVRLVAMPEGQDPFDFLRERGREPFDALVEAGADLLGFKLSYLRNQYDTATLDGKAAVARELVATAVRCSEPVRRDLYVKRIAEELAISESAVLAEAARLERRPVRAREAGAVQRPSRGPLDAAARAQRLLIGAMLNDSAVVPEVDSAVGEAGFADRRIRCIAREIFRLYREDAGVEARRVTEGIPDPAVIELLADVCSEEGSRACVPDEIAGSIDYLVNKDIPKRTMQVTREKALEASRTGDEDAEKRLLAMYAERSKKVKGRQTTD